MRATYILHALSLFPLQPPAPWLHIACNTQIINATALSPCICRHAGAALACGSAAAPARCSAVAAGRPAASSPPRTRRRRPRSERCVRVSATEGFSHCAMLGRGGYASVARAPCNTRGASALPVREPWLMAGRAACKTRLSALHLYAVHVIICIQYRRETCLSAHRITHHLQQTSAYS